MAFELSPAANDEIVLKIQRFTLCAGQGLPIVGEPEFLSSLDEVKPILAELKYEERARTQTLACPRAHLTPCT